MHVCRTMKMHASCMLANFGRQPSPRVLEQVSDPRFGTSKLVQDGLQFFQFIPCSSYDLSVSLVQSRKHFSVISFNIQMDIVINGCGPVLRLRITMEGWFPWVSVKLEGDGGWIHPDEESDFLVNNEVEYSDIQLASIRQPSPPPVLAKISDPRHRTSELPQDGLHFANSYHDLHISVRLMEDFLRLAVQNTAMNLETCGVLAGSLRNRVFQVTTLIIPKQESTSYSCQTLNEEEIFEVQDNNSLFSLGWIHTHPTQTCFMSSVDLHTHFSYQVMLREAIAIVMAPTDKSSPHGIFHLSDPAGVGLIRNCEERGFHPHYEPEDGSPIYERCSHVYIDPCLRHDVIDLR
ncbi:AMSH-like ubiquitin thioesterase 2 isoform X1 [Primulina eburnea]|uniref:AMSH-like ubiquitin thioesterase 2 isoform X1 n=2 Tax=Primulina eburnea TaxID=1245227 RepID=UPI003C6C6C2C